MERIVKLIQESNPQSSVKEIKKILCLEFVANIKEKGYLKKKNILIDHERRQSVWVKKFKTICLEKMSNKKKTTKKKKKKTTKKKKQQKMSPIRSQCLRWNC